MHMINNSLIDLLTRLLGGLRYDTAAIRFSPRSEAASCALAPSWIFATRFPTYYCHLYLLPVATCAYCLLRPVPLRPAGSLQPVRDPLLPPVSIVCRHLCLLPIATCALAPSWIFATRSPTYYRPSECPNPNSKPAQQSEHKPWMLPLPNPLDPSPRV
jgi:hypothetical protein